MMYRYCHLLYCHPPSRAIDRLHSDWFEIYENWAMGTGLYIENVVESIVHRLKYAITVVFSVSSTLKRGTRVNMEIKIMQINGIIK